MKLFRKKKKKTFAIQLINNQALVPIVLGLAMDP